MTRHHVSRSLIILALAGSHLLVLMQLFELRPPSSSGASSRALQVTFIPAPPPITPTVGEPARTPPARRQKPQTSGSAIVSVPPSEPVAPRIDWKAEAQRAAASAGAESSPYESFDPRERPLAEPKQKPFGWDPTQTQKVEVLPQGGMLIRLSENCALVLAPLPIGGCGIGKRKARGDLFDGMSAPRRAGDWKDDSRLP